MQRRVVVRVLGGVAAAALIAWLALVVLEQTTFEADLRRREASAETTLGDLSCRKDFRATFPFFTLRCREVQEP